MPGKPLNLRPDAWRNHIPHAGAMALIERVHGFEADSIHAESDNHRDPAHPLRHDGRLHAIHLCEYGAQAMAVHGALCASAAFGAGTDDAGSPANNIPRPGLLTALRDVQLHVERIDELPGPLTIRAQRQHADQRAWLYGFQVHHGEQLLASGRAMVVLEAAPAGQGQAGLDQSGLAQSALAVPGTDKK
ncbi:MAG: phosphotransferase [Xanthomonadales bacterium]|nr:phosphotransferase [Xanthomonadales bacterium]